MKNTTELPLARIGNSRGVRLPVALIRKHGLESGVILEERDGELILRPKRKSPKLSWADTAREMAAATEDWSDWDTASADGLALVSWQGKAPGVKRATRRRP